MSKFDTEYTLEPICPFSQDYLIYDAVRRIDAMIEAEVLKNNPKFVKSNNEQQGE